MKKITIDSILNSLENMEYEVNVPEHVRTKAKKALDRMIDISGS